MQKFFTRALLNCAMACLYGSRLCMQGYFRIAEKSKAKACKIATRNLPA